MDRHIGERTGRRVCHEKGELNNLLTDDEFKSFLKALGLRIKAIRKDKNMNMRDIMIATGHYDAQWRKYEAGGSMNLMSLMKVALALEVSLSQLLDGLAQWPLKSVSEISEHNAKRISTDHMSDRSDTEVPVGLKSASKAGPTQKATSKASVIGHLSKSQSDA